jgi:hypothetical protein
MDTEQLTSLILGPALARLSMTFPTRDAYRDFWRAHPALGSDWGPDVEAYVDYDLAGREPDLVSRVNAAAVLADAQDQVEGVALRAALAALGSAEVDMLRAPLGLLAQPPGLYPEPLLESYAPAFPGLRYRSVPDVNHYTLLLSERGASAVAHEIGELLRSE